ncbi:MAG: HAMP domain-containing sensor histidine kinase [Sphingobium sp.]
MADPQPPIDPASETPRPDVSRTRRGRTTAKAVAARRTDEASARERDMFIAGLTHELRTPLAILKGRLHALEDGVIDPETGECGRLLEQVDKLLRITEGLTTLAKAHARELLLDLRCIDLSRVVAMTVQELRAEAEANCVSLHEAYQEVIVECDPARIAQGLGALLHFALSLVPPGGSLSIKFAPLAERAVVILSSPDWNLGPDEERRLSVPTWETGGGTNGTRSDDNIGPALAAALFRAHGWQLTTEHQADGSTAAIVLNCPRR